MPVGLDGSPVGLPLWGSVYGYCVEIGEEPHERRADGGDLLPNRPPEARGGEFGVQV